MSTPQKDKYKMCIKLIDICIYIHIYDNHLFACMKHSKIKTRNNTKNTHHLLTQIIETYANFIIYNEAYKFGEKNLLSSLSYIVPGDIILHIG